MTIGSVLVMGIGGGLLLATLQAALADHHGESRTVALAEANVAASTAYVALVAVLSLAAALHAGWRVALLASLAVPALAWIRSRRVAIEAPPRSRAVHGGLPGVFWIAAAMLFCTTAAEWCVTAWRYARGARHWSGCNRCRASAVSGRPTASGTRSHGPGGRC